MTEPAGPEETPFPPAPWHLRGSLWISVWRVKKGRDGDAPVSNSLAGLIATVWAHYEAGGTLQYEEFAVVKPTWGKGLLSPAGTVELIWVSSGVSAQGGRELWRIPKQIADFDIDISARDGTLDGKVSQGGEDIAELHFKRRSVFPGALGLSLFAVQPGPGGPVRTRCTVRGRVSTGRAEWTFSAAGPLAVLRDHTPLFSLSVTEADMLFGV